MTRRDKRGPRRADMDQTFPFMTIDEASTVRSMAHQAFAEAGIEVVILAGQLVGADGCDIGLHNLMATCRHAEHGRRQWPALVNAHVRAVQAATTSPHPLDAMSDDEALARTFLRVVETPLPEQLVDHVRYARDVSGILVETLVLDTTTALITLTDADLDRLGEDRAREAGLENLLRQPIEAVHEIDLGEGAVVRAVRGGPHTASKALVLPDFLRRLDGDGSYPNGMLVGMPFRHYLLLHPLVGPEAVAATTRLAGLTRMAFDNEAGPVSPVVHWWRDGRMTPLAWLDSVGSMFMTEDREYAELLVKLYD